MKGKVFIIVGSAVLAIFGIFLIYHLLFGVGNFKGRPAIKMDDRQSLFNEAKRLSAKGDKDGAIKSFELLITGYPDSDLVEEALFELAAIYEGRRDLVRAKDTYQKIIEKFPDSKNVAKAQENLENVNIKILFSSIITQDSLLYEIQKGDSLDKLAKKFNTTIELISKTNELKSSNIRIGKKLKLSKASFSIVVDKSQNILTLKSDGNILKTYRVSTGQSFSTPIGTFKITTKVVDPPWYPPTGGEIPFGDPKNILGSRWMGISHPGYGIHGTTEPESIGKNVTAGCIRMTNADVEELYTIVPPGIEVLIVD